MMKVFATASVLALVAGPTLAGSLAEPVIAPQPAAPVVYEEPQSLWTGGYVGAQAGYGWANSDAGDGEGAIGGLHAGYLANSGRFVYGGEAAYNWTDIDLEDDAGTIDGIADLKLKAGYDLGRTLLYATAGASYADASSGSDWGWNAGAGVDYMVNQNWSVGAEALYHKFDDFDDTGVDADGTTLAAKVSYHF